MPTRKYKSTDAAYWYGFQLFSCIYLNTIMLYSMTVAKLVTILFEIYSIKKIVAVWELMDIKH